MVAVVNEMSGNIFDLLYCGCYFYYLQDCMTPATVMTPDQLLGEAAAGTHCKKTEGGYSKTQHSVLSTLPLQEGHTQAHTDLS